MTTRGSAKKPTAKRTPRKPKALEADTERPTSGLSVVLVRTPDPLPLPPPVPGEQRHGPTARLDLATLADEQRAAGLDPPYVFFKDGSRVAFTAGAHAAATALHAPRTASVGAFSTAHMALHQGLPEIVDAIMELAASEGAPGRNWLSEVGGRVELAVRRAILRRLLETLRWNLSHVRDVTGMTDATAVRREIRRVGLEAEYRRAVRRGDVRPGGHRDRPEPTTYNLP